MVAAALCLCDYNAATQVATITLNNPRALNALSGPMGLEFKGIIESIVDRCGPGGDIGAVVLTGAGKAFSAGGDTVFLTERAFKSTPEVNTNEMLKFYSLFMVQLRRLRCPTIAAVNGTAIGAGFTFAMAADLHIIAEEARISQNYTKLGLHPGMGATHVLPRTLSREAVNYILLTGRQMSGKEAVALGLGLKTMPTGADVLKEAQEIATEIAGNGRLSVLQTKETIDEQWMPGLTRALRREADGQAVSYPGWEFQASITALTSKTAPPNFGEMRKSKM